MPSIRRKQSRTVRKYNDHTKTDRSIYDSYKWRKLREYMKERRRMECYGLYMIDVPLCEIACAGKTAEEVVYDYSMGNIEEATVCDHIIPVNEGGSVWSMSNLQMIGYRAHQRKSAKERHT